MNWNLAVSVRHPVFREAYKQFVLPHLLANEREAIEKELNGAHIMKSTGDLKYVDMVFISHG